MTKKRSILLFICLTVLTASCSVRPEAETTGGGQATVSPVSQSGKFGYIDKTGKIVIDLQFDYALDFSEGLAGFTVFKKWSPNKWGYIDKTGHVVIKPQFNQASSFSEGMAVVKVDNKWAYIDKMGTLILEPEVEVALSFSDGLALTMTKHWPGIDEWSYIDKTGTRVTEPQFSNRHDYGFVQGLPDQLSGGKAAYILWADKPPSMKVFIEPSHGDTSGFSEGLAVMEDICIWDDCQWNYIDKTGNVVIEQRFDVAGPFSEGLASVMIGQKWGYIDKTGNVVIKPQFDMAWRFSEGLAAVLIGGKFGYIDKMGKIVLEPQFDGTGPFSEGLAPVMVDQKWGYIDKTGNVVIKPQFDQASSFSEGLAVVTVGREEGAVGKVKAHGLRWFFYF
ncbi:MAG: WG repeat-containing protein [Thaumarchaeota archaeon]|nr:WG repeat-containing protein [Nitrososphaerota archaeon]